MQPPHQWPPHVDSAQNGLAQSGQARPGQAHFGHAQIGQHDSSIWWLAFFISLLLHFALIPLLPRIALHDNLVPVVPENNDITIEEFKTLGQIVEVDAPGQKEPPSKTSYLSDANRQVEQQTQALQSGAKGARPTTPSMAPPRQGAAGVGQTQGQVDGGQSPSPKLQIDLPADWVAGLSSPSNYLPDVQMGESTLLNTKEYAYAPFFIRMKQSLDRVWSPQAVLRRQSPDPSPEYRTGVEIVLNSDGSVFSAKVVIPSSIQGLDQEAIRSVYQAGPYVNPPKGLIGMNGKIIIPNFFFIITQKRPLF